MKAVRFHETGPADVMRYEDVADPTPGDGELLVRVRAAGINFIDTYQRSGAYKVELPRTAGDEGAGDVVAVGPGVSGFKAGDRVAFRGAGAYAELATPSADRVVHLPDGVDYETGAAVLLQGMTAHFLTHSCPPLEPGDTCLVHAAAGGVGLLLTQMAKKIGARVIGTTSTEEKAALAREAGADEIILYTQQDFVAETRRFTDGAGVRVVYDSVGKDTFDGSLDCLAPKGYMILFGQSSGRVEPVDPQVLNQKGSLFLTRPTLAHYGVPGAEADWRAGDLFRWLADGSLNFRIGASFPLERAADAHRALEGRQTTGKVVLTVP